MNADTSTLAPAILIVDDDADQRELVRETLELHFPRSRGKIALASLGRECLSLDLNRFDIILLDYNLPDMPGLELLKQVMEHCRAPVIFVTGESVPATAAQAIELGAQDYIIKLGNYLLTLPVMVEKNLRLHELKLENAALHEELTRRMEQIRITNIQLQESLHTLQTMAGTDHLTGLANRRSFSELLERSFREATRYDFDLACAMCDLDSFKQLNDTLGHQAGDKILVMAADSIRANLRASDMAARYGGDEFVLLLPHTSMEMALLVANRIRQQLVLATGEGMASKASGSALAKPGLAVANSGLAVAESGLAVATPGVTMSIGLASLKSDHPKSADALVAMADRALYAAKDCGKNCIVTFEQFSCQPSAQ
jgi:diguanylate cyclase (GGDEF)-like protein